MCWDRCLLWSSELNKDGVYGCFWLLVSLRSLVWYFFFSSFLNTWQNSFSGWVFIHLGFYCLFLGCLKWFLKLFNKFLCIHIYTHIHILHCYSRNTEIVFNILYFLGWKPHDKNMWFWFPSVGFLPQLCLSPVQVKMWYSTGVWMSLVYSCGCGEYRLVLCECSVTTVWLNCVPLNTWYWVIWIQNYKWSQSGMVS